jgi:tetratricopeptide (TPR) repeat protein
MRALRIVTTHCASVIGFSLLMACASQGPRLARTGERAPAQPLRHISLAPTAQGQDALALLMAGEFAIIDGDLESASRNYSAAAATSDDPAIAEQATHVAVIGKRWDQARIAIDRWNVLQPDAAGISQARAALAFADGDTDGAVVQLSKLAQQPDGKGWRMIGQALLAAPDKASAGAALERLAQPDTLGEQADIWIGVSQLAFKLERKAYAQKLADQAVAKFRSGESYAWSAQLALDSGDKAQAKALFGQALKRDAKSVRLRIGYATLLGDMGENVEAARALAEGGQDDYTYSARAAYAARANDKVLIDALYKELQVLPGAPNGARANLLGQLAELLERKDAALDWYRKIGDDDEHYLGAQLRVAVLLDDLGKSEDALNLVHELQARAGDDSRELGQTFLLEAELLGRHERGAEGLLVYDRGLHLLPDDTRLLYARALLHESLNQVEAAEQDLRRVVALKPDDADALNALGYTLADRTDRHGEALELIKQALLLKPEEAAIMDSLGWAQYRLGNLSEAITALRGAFTKQPDAEIAAHLGEVLWISGDKDEARKVWDIGRKKDDKNKTLLETIKRLGT